MGVGFSPGAGWAQTEDVVWTGAAGVSVSGSSLTKTAATGWGNAGASSLQSLESAGFVEFVATETDTWRMLGLSKGDSDQNYPDIDFGLGLGFDVLIHVYEQGSPRGTFGSYATGDRFRIEVGGGVVRYRKNGVVFYTSPLAPQFPLLVDAALYDSGATLSSVEIGRGSFIADTGVTVTGRTLTKTGDAGWNAGAVSALRTFWGDGSVEFTAAETDKRRAAGLSHGDAGTDVSDIDFALVLLEDATLEIQEGGVSRGTFGPYATTDRFRVEAVGGTVRYYRNGVLLYTSAQSPSYPLLADTAFDHMGSTLADVVVSDVVWSSTSGVSLLGNSLKKTGTAGWNAGAVSTAALGSGDGFVEFTATETTTNRMCGLGTSDSGPSDADIEFAVQLTSEGEVKVYESGTLQGTYGTYASGDRFRVELRSGTVRYRKNGVTFYTSTVTPTYPLTVDTSLDTPGATLSEVLFGNLVWDNEVGVVVRGYGLARTTPNSTWGDSGAATTAAIPFGDGFVEFMATEASLWRVVGLSNGDADQNYTDIDFAIGLSNIGVVHVYEAGEWRGSFTGYVPGDRLQVGVEEGVVKYRKNGEVFYTSTVTPQYPLLVDTAFYDLSASVADVHLYLAPTPTVASPTFSPPGGSYTSALSVQVSCGTPLATLHYTTNGEDPTEADDVVGGALNVPYSLTLKVRGYRPGFIPSAVASETYWLALGPAATPTFDPPPGSYAVAQDVSLQSATPGATVRFTLDGSEATEASPVFQAPLHVASSTTIRARAFAPDHDPSLEAAGAYMIGDGGIAAPVFSPAAGRYATSQSVRILSPSPGVIVRYTTNGLEPTETDPIADPENPIVVDASRLLIAKGWKQEIESPVSQAFYLITGAVAFGDYHGLILRADGAILSWGQNGAGQLGDGTTTPRLTPGAVQLPSLVKAISIAAGGDHSLALSATGTVWSWGANDQGQVGDGTTTPRATPQLVTIPGVRIVAIAASPSHSMALDASGEVWSWGWGVAQPTKVAGLQDVVAVADGVYHRLALTHDGAVYAWGNNGRGQLGNGAFGGDVSVPTLVAGLSGVSQIAAGEYFSLALKTDGQPQGSVLTWGGNDNGELGIGSTQWGSATPVVALTGVTAIAAGRGHALALASDGVLWAWGRGESGQIGNGSSLLRRSPVRVTSVVGALAISCGGATSLAIAPDGTVWLWGAGGSVWPLALSDVTAVENEWLTQDSDGDGLSNAGEWQFGCDASRPDSNGDGLADGPEVGLGLSCSNPDMDADGVPNATERTRGTDPFRADTDGDGASDGVDCFPLDPTQTCPPGDSGDQTPPVITLLEPVNATPQP